MTPRTTPRTHAILFSISAFFLVAIVVLSSAAPRLVGTAVADRSSGAKIVDAARAFLASLDEKQRAAATFDYSDKERFNWHFIPRDRKGLAFKDLSESQREKFDALLAAALSKVGHETVHDVRFLEAVLQKIEGAGRRFSRDPELYFVSVFGKPDVRGAWAWRFEGHHLSINFALQGDDVVSPTPYFLGANPALVPEGPRKGLRVLAGVEDIARSLVKSLDDEQRGEAIGKDKPIEVSGTTSRVYEGPFPPGIKGKALQAPQKEMLRKLIRGYTKHLAADIRKTIEDAMERDDGLDRVQFAWRGGLEPREGHSYVVHGPTFVASYANFQGGALHIHSGLRYLPREFGVESRTKKKKTAFVEPR